MEQIQAVVDLITNQGTSIVMLVVFIYGLRYLFMEYKNARDSYDENYNEQISQIKELADAVNNNTITLTRLVEKIDNERKEVE